MFHYWDLFLMALSRAHLTRILRIISPKYDAPHAHRSVSSLVTLLQAGSLRSQFYIIFPKYDIQPAVQVSNSSGYSDATELISSIHRPCAKPYMALCQTLFAPIRSEEHTSALQSQSTISYAVLCLKKKKQQHKKLD